MFYLFVIQNYCLFLIYYAIKNYEIVYSIEQTKKKKPITIKLTNLPSDIIHITLYTLTSVCLSDRISYYLLPRQL